MVRGDPKDIAKAKAPQTARKSTGGRGKRRALQPAAQRTCLPRAAAGGGPAAGPAAPAAGPAAGPAAPAAGPAAPAAGPAAGPAGVTPAAAAIAGIKRPHRWRPGTVSSHADGFLTRLSKSNLI